MTDIFLHRSDRTVLNGSAAGKPHDASAGVPHSAVAHAPNSISPATNGSSGGNSNGHAASWSLTSTHGAAFRCSVCGRHWLRHGECCARATARLPLPYYIAAASRPEEGRPEFSVVMPTKNLLRLTQVAMDSLLKAAAGHSVQFIFVDCASTDGSHRYFKELAKKHDVKVIVTHPDELFIYSRNCNRGAQAATGQILVFANNDIEVCDPGLFDKLSLALRDPRVGVVGTRTDYDCSNEVQQRRSLEAPYVWTKKPVMGFLWAMRAEVFAELEGLDERFSGYGCDEIDFQYRAIQRNYRIAVADSLVHHDLHATFGYELQDRLAENVARFDEKHNCRLRHQGRWYGPFLDHIYPRVSVAIACRNQGSFLQRALDSVLGNHVSSQIGVQVVVVDDASTDETALIMRRCMREQPERVTALSRSISRGPAAAKNDAIRRCIGDYVALLDADDEFLEYKLMRSVEELERTGAEFLYHDFVAVLPDGMHRHDRIGNWSLKRWRAGRSLPPSTWVFRHGTVEFCEQFVTGEDPEFLRRNWRRLNSVYLPEALTRYHVHGGGLSSRSNCRVVTGQLKGLKLAEVRNCSDIHTQTQAPDKTPGYSHA